MSEPQSTDGPADDMRPQEVELYAAMLTFMKQRMLYTDELLTGPLRRVDLEVCALQIRVTLEKIVLSTLLTNRPGVQAVMAAFAKKNAGDVHALIKRINPRYWPVPFESVYNHEKEPGIWRMIEPSEPYLREDDWGKAYGFCSALLHATNPYKYLEENSKDLVSEQVGRLREYSIRIQRLLKRHQVLMSEVDFCLVCSVPEDTSIRPKIEVLRRLSR